MTNNTSTEGLKVNDTKYYLIYGVDKPTKIPLENLNNAPIACPDDWVSGIEVISTGIESIDHWATPLYNRCDMDYLQTKICSLLDMVLVNQTQLKASKQTLDDIFREIRNRKVQDTIERAKNC